MILTSEAVMKGHPDKMCDYISDSILDECLNQDKNSRVAVETMIMPNQIIVSGEITTNAIIDIEKMVRFALYELGYDPLKFKVKSYISTQSLDIAKGVDLSIETREGKNGEKYKIGAGDQGIVYGFATDETSALMPASYLFATKICKAIDIARCNGIIKGLNPDGKAQVSIDTKKGKIKTIVVSVSHDKDKDKQVIENEIRHLLNKLFRKIEDTEILINPSGRFIKFGPDADTGLTGRKIMVDTYGGIAHHGGGAFSGKDPTKVDRSAAYMARFIAKHVVAARLAKKCEVSIGYAIGKAEPVSFSIETFNTSIYENERIEKAVMNVFSLTPYDIIKSLDLRNVCYKNTSSYGHFTGDFNWEKVDDEIIKRLRAEVLKG